MTAQTIDVTILPAPPQETEQTSTKPCMGCEVPERCYYPYCGCSRQPIGQANG